MKVPKTLEEAIEIFRTNTPITELEQWKSEEEEDAVASIHFSLGRWMRNSWGLWSGDSDLAKFFHSLGIKHADDMSGIILTSAHRALNNKDIKLDEQVQFYKKYWKKTETEKDRNT